MSEPARIFFANWTQLLATCAYHVCVVCVCGRARARTLFPSAVEGPAPPSAPEARLRPPIQNPQKWTKTTRQRIPIAKIIFLQNHPTTFCTSCPSFALHTPSLWFFSPCDLTGERGAEEGAERQTV